MSSGSESPVQGVGPIALRIAWQAGQLRSALKQLRGQTAPVRLPGSFPLNRRHVATRRFLLRHQYFETRHPNSCRASNRPRFSPDEPCRMLGWQASLPGSRHQCQRRHSIIVQREQVLEDSLGIPFAFPLEESRGLRVGLQELITVGGEPVRQVVSLTKCQGSFRCAPASSLSSALHHSASAAG